MSESRGQRFAEWASALFEGGDYDLVNVGRRVSADGRMDAAIALRAQQKLQPLLRLSNDNGLRRVLKVTKERRRGSSLVLSCGHVRKEPSCMFARVGNLRPCEPCRTKISIAKRKLKRPA